MSRIRCGGIGRERKSASRIGKWSSAQLLLTPRFVKTREPVGKVLRAMCHIRKSSRSTRIGGNETLVNSGRCVVAEDDLFPNTCSEEFGRDTRSCLAINGLLMFGIILQGCNESVLTEVKSSPEDPSKQSRLPLQFCLVASGIS